MVYETFLFNLSDTFCQSKTNQMISERDWSRNGLYLYDIYIYEYVHSRLDLFNKLPSHYQFFHSRSQLDSCIGRLRISIEFRDRMSQRCPIHEYFEVIFKIASCFRTNVGKRQHKNKFKRNEMFAN